MQTKRVRLVPTTLVALIIAACAPTAGVISTDPLKPGRDATGESTSTTVPWAGDSLAVIPLALATGSDQDYHNLTAPSGSHLEIRKKAIIGKCVCRPSSEINIDTGCSRVTVAMRSRAKGDENSLE